MDNMTAQTRKGRYKRYAYTLQPGESIRPSLAGNQVTCLESTVPFRMRVDMDPETDFEAGLFLREESGFSGIELRNNDVVANTIVLGISTGQVGDNRSSFAGQVEVQDTSGNSFSEVAVAIETVRAEVRAAGLIDLTGATLDWVQAAKTFVTAGANENGVLIHNVMISGASGYLLIDGVRQITNLTTAPIALRNVLVPAGLSIAFLESGNSTCSIAYTVLS